MFRKARFPSSSIARTLKQTHAEIWGESVGRGKGEERRMMDRRERGNVVNKPLLVQRAGWVLATPRYSSARQRSLQQLIWIGKRAWACLSSLDSTEHSLATWPSFRTHARPEYTTTPDSKSRLTESRRFLLAFSWNEPKAFHSIQKQEKASEIRKSLEIRKVQKQGKL